MDTPFRVFVVRPYHAKIRERMFGVLQQLGGEIPAEWVVPNKATDDEVVDQLTTKQPDVLLIPFHIGKDSNGKLVTGLTALIAIRRAYSWARQAKVLMPISVVGQGAFTIQWAEFQKSQDSRQIMILKQDELEHPGLPDRIAIHLGLNAAPETG